MDWNHDAEGDLPVTGMSWEEAQLFARWAGGRLPTEAEWEYASRAGSTADRYAAPDEIAWHFGNSMNQTHPVAQKRANASGLYDVIGNVWEWCADWYGAYSVGFSSTRPDRPRASIAFYVEVTVVT